MAEALGIQIGTVVGNTTPQEFTFFMRSYAARLGDLVSVGMSVPSGKYGERQEVIVWGRIVELARFNPFLPAEAAQELAEENMHVLDTVLSNSRDQIEGRVLILGCTSPGDIKSIRPLSYPVNPGAEVHLPPAEVVKRILTGDENVPRLHLGHLIGRPDVDVKLKTNAIVARHMAILAMTGGGKTVASRRVIRELIETGYPLVIFDPHGDYLGLWDKRELFKGADIKLYYPRLIVKEENRDTVGYLIAQMTQGLSDAQREKFIEALDSITTNLPDEGMTMSEFIELMFDKLDSIQATHKGTIPAVKRALRIVRGYMEAMEASNDRLRKQPRLKEYPFEPMPDPFTAAPKFVAPGQATIIYLGGYDHLTQSTIVALTLKSLFEKRASMSNEIPPLLAVVEEAHNFIPSASEGQSETPSVEIIRKVITEGRKFGVGLLLISQRPSRLDETTLSQCNTFMIFRLVNPRDQAFVEKVMENLTKADSKLLPGFGPGQGIVSGQAVRFPLIIQVAIDKELIPQSLGDEDFVTEVKTWAKTDRATANKRSEEFEKDLK